MKFLVANWKMNKDWYTACQYLDDLDKRLKDKINQNPSYLDVEIVIAPPFPFLKYASTKQKINVAAQNCYYEENGSYTGEVSVNMLKSVGVEYIILGHSERRKYFNETELILNKKIKTALNKNVKVIFCVGEPMDSRKKNEHITFVKNQLLNTLKDLDETHLKNLIIAYEPLWAIGTNINPSINEISEMHAAIKNYCKKLFGVNILENIPVIYGGNLNPTNALDILKIKEVDGGLVGRSSLMVDSFLDILNCFIA